MTIDIAKFFTRTNILRVLSLIMAAFAAGGFVTTAPKMASPAGVPINDFLNTLIPGVGAVLAWLWSNWSKVSPELVTAVIAFVRNPSDLATLDRAVIALLLFLRQVRPDSKALAALDQASREIRNELLGTVNEPR